MKSILSALLVLFTLNVSQAAIKCAGYNVIDKNDQIGVLVDGNPLKISHGILTPAKGWGSVLVNVLEKEGRSLVILGESENYGSYPKNTAEFKTGSKGLPTGSNATLVTRSFSVVNRIQPEKHSYVLNCTGKLPKVYQDILSKSKK